MKTDRKATYGSLDTASIKRNEKRQQKASKEISEPSSSSVLQSQGTSDIPLDGSFSSDLEVEPVNEPIKRSHKLVVKTGVELFLPADFILHEKLVAAVRRINISPANLSTIVNVLIEIGDGNIDYVNTSYSYIQKHYTNITKEVSSVIYGLLKKPSCALGRKNYSNIK